MRATQRGVANTRIVLLGDSTTAGFGSGATDGWAPAGYPNTPGPLLAAKLNAAGINASAAAFFGTGSRSTVSQPTFDSRFTFDEATWAGVNESLGNALWRNTGVLNMNYAPTASFDTLEVRTATFNVAEAGVLGVYIDSVQVGTINCRAATNPLQAYVTQTYKVAAGVHTVAFKKESGTAAYVHSAYPYLSTKKEVSIFIGGRPSAAAVTVADDVNPWASLNVIRALQPHLTMICVGLNDYPTPTPQVTFEDAVTRMVAAAKASGDALLVIPNSRNSAVNEAIVNGYLQNVSSQTNTPIIDRRVAIGTFAAATAGSLMFDGVHPNAAGYALIAAYEAARLSA